MSRSRPLFSLLVVLPLAGFSWAVRAPVAPPTADPDLVTICHNAGPNKQIEIKVAEEAVPAHVAQHGDWVVDENNPCAILTVF